MIIEQNMGRCSPCECKGQGRNNESADKNQTKVEPKIMNTTIVSAEAKARLTEAVKSYMPPRRKNTAR